jgi:hypothetical protein
MTFKTSARSRRSIEAVTTAVALTRRFRTARAMAFIGPRGTLDLATGARMLKSVKAGRRDAGVLNYRKKNHLA